MALHFGIEEWQELIFTLPKKDTTEMGSATKVQMNIYSTHLPRVITTFMLKFFPDTTQEFKKIAFLKRSRQVCQALCLSNKRAYPA